MRPDNVGLGGFDSHALPPALNLRSPRPLQLEGKALAIASAVAVVRIIPVVLFLIAANQAVAVEARAQSTPVDSTKPPISAKQAFLYSLAVPGLGQARLERPLVGAGFFLVEALAVAILHRTTDDLRLARAYRGDSIPLRYDVSVSTGLPTLGSNGNPVVVAWQKAYYNDALIKARRLQVEDWSAILVFNHLISAAEAFVGAQLWDLPQHVRIRATPLRGGGIGIAARIGSR